MVKTALLFAGQGAQVVGMGRNLAEKFDHCRALFSQADEILGYDLARVCLDGPEAELTKTEHAQPGIYLVSFACLNALESQIPNFKSRIGAAAGLSLGEFTALAVAGAISFEDGLRLVRRRGQFMQEACDATSGAMAAIIGAEESQVRELCREADVDLANLNAPGQIIISGEKDRIACAIEIAKSKGIKKAIPLNVAGAYHSRLMAAARPRLAKELEGIELRPPGLPVVSNVIARPIQSPDEIRHGLIQQITSTVRWEESMRWLIEQGFTRFIELGPGNVLSGLMKRIDRNVTMLHVSDCASLDATVRQLSSG
jgi:[acyl-carrier-protein] S-malonyltransferase